MFPRIEGVHMRQVRHKGWLFGLGVLPPVSTTGNSIILTPTSLADAHAGETTFVVTIEREKFAAYGVVDCSNCARQWFANHGISNKLADKIVSKLLPAAEAAYTGPAHQWN